MFEKNLGPLALYVSAGEDITYPVTGSRAAPIYQAISYIFTKAEQVTDLLQPPRSKNNTHTNLEANDQNSKRGRLN
jgi:O-acetylhomoserine/O-acetylserine sulfhydrylase-like pyridoxal-dependent enzyme